MGGDKIGEEIGFSGAAGACDAAEAVCEAISESDGAGVGVCFVFVLSAAEKCHQSERNPEHPAQDGNEDIESGDDEHDGPAEKRNPCKEANERR